jgi:hypothetical protein
MFLCTANFDEVRVQLRVMDFASCFLWVWNNIIYVEGFKKQFLRKILGLSMDEVKGNLGYYFVRNFVICIICVILLATIG